VTQPEPPSPLDLLRDPRAAVDTGLGPVAFVIANAVAGLHTAAAVAVGLSVVLMIERLIRRRPIINAVGGLLGTGLAAFIALRTGRPEGYFVPRMLYQVALAVVFCGSVLVRRPVVGFIMAALHRADPGWAGHPAVGRAMTELTLAWAALFAIRAGVYAVLIAAGKAGWLAAASIVMGWPAFALLAFGSYRYAPRRIEQLGGPPPRRAPTP
jgi:ABC-type tungstate transport system substrate-binding protein